MALINVSNVSFSYEGSCDLIFDHVSFKIDSNWKLGFIGRNGRGKTTFLNLLRGKYSFHGDISSPLAFDYFPLDIKDKSLQTIYVINEFYPENELWKVNKEFHLLNLSEDVLYQSYQLLSLGEQTKVMLAILFAADHHFLLIDEPTNHLDLQARELVSQYLNSKKGFILVSHDQYFLDSCVNHILSINKADITVTRGNFSTWWENKIRHDQFELDKNKKLKKEIKHLDAAKKQTANWSDKLEDTKIGSHSGDRGRIGHLAAKMMKRSKATEFRQNRSIEEKSKLLKNIEVVDGIILKPFVYHKEYLIRAADLSISYQDKKIFSDLRFDIKRGEQVALIGSNGSGKTSIIKLLLGEDICYKGNLTIGSQIIISLVSQDTSFLKGDLKKYAKYENIDESLFKSMLRKLDFDRKMFDQDMYTFSEGQKKKVLIAKSLSQQAHLYIWDEPLNYVDILSRLQIESLIATYKPTMLFVEHDKIFVEKIASKIIIL